MTMLLITIFLFFSCSKACEPKKAKLDLNPINIEYTPCSLRTLSAKVAFPHLAVSDNLKKCLMKRLPRELVDYYINFPLDRGRGPLCFASLKNVPILIQNGASIITRDVFGHSVIDFFVREGKFEHAKVALENSNKEEITEILNRINSKEKKTTHLSTLLNQLDEIERKKADELDGILTERLPENEQHKKPRTLSYHDVLESLQILSTVDSSKNILMRTELHTTQDPKEISRILEQHPNLEEQDIWRNTPLMHHIAYGSLACAHELLKHGAKHYNKNSDHALPLAIKTHARTLLPLLIIDGITTISGALQSNSRDSLPFICLAALHSSNEAIKLIIDKGLYPSDNQQNFNSKDSLKNLKAALLLAIKNGNEFGVQYLTLAIQRLSPTECKIPNDPVTDFSQADNPLTLRGAARTHYPQALEYLDLILEP